MATEETLESTVKILRNCGLNAASADTGGGTDCIVIADADSSSDEPRFIFGTAADRWAAEADGVPDGIWTEVSSAETDPRAIASGILVALSHVARVEN
jgi:hypothetical protein